MAETQWEKTTFFPEQKVATRSGRWKYLVAGFIILGVIVYLMFFGTGLGARQYVTVDDLVSNPELLGKKVNVTGAVVGDPTFDSEAKELHFIIANIPNDNDTISAQGGLAQVLYNAVNDPNATRIAVVARGQEKPDMLQHEAQAILSGEIVEENGQLVFYANDIKLKCPSKYEEAKDTNTASG